MMINTAWYPVLTDLEICQKLRLTLGSFLLVCLVACNFGPPQEVAPPPKNNTNNNALPFDDLEEIVPHSEKEVQILPPVPVPLDMPQPEPVAEIEKDAEEVELEFEQDPNSAAGLNKKPIAPADSNAPATPSLLSRASSTAGEIIQGSKEIASTALSNTYRWASKKINDASSWSISSAKYLYDKVFPTPKPLSPWQSILQRTKKQLAEVRHPEAAAYLLSEISFNAENEADNTVENYVSFINSFAQNSSSYLQDSNQFWQCQAIQVKDQATLEKNLRKKYLKQDLDSNNLLEQLGKEPKLYRLKVQKAPLLSFWKEIENFPTLFKNLYNANGQQTPDAGLLNIPVYCRLQQKNSLAKTPASIDP